MSVICPTVLARDSASFRQQMSKIMPFAKRIQIDLTDGEFAPTITLPIDRIWWPESIEVDIHLMYQRPLERLSQLINLNPRMVIIHFEANVDHAHFALELQRKGIKAGLALLKQTTVQEARHLFEYFDHLLIFSGDLGKFGGRADLQLLEKATQTKLIKPGMEIGWDGGINADNANDLIKGGVDVLNVGGYIQNDTNPQNAYDTMVSIGGDKNE